MAARQSSTRKHNTANKVYISNHARDNQYLLAKFELTDSLIQHIDSDFDINSPTPYKNFYKRIRNTIFALCEQHNVTTAHFIGNDKLPMVRFSGEPDAIETDDKIFFFYNPKYHQGHKYFYDFDTRSRRLSVLFLANGDDIRVDAASFHQKISALTKELNSTLGLNEGDIRLRDHQHITYDLFGQQKEKADSQSHKFRPIAVRYSANEIELPAHRGLTYVVADIYLNAKIRKLAQVDYDAPSPYEPLYSMINDSFVSGMEKAGLKNGAMIANGLTPLIRFGSSADNKVNKGFQMIGFDPENAADKIFSEWQGDVYTDKVRLVFLASDQHRSDRGYGKYVNQVVKVLETVAARLEVEPSQEQLMIRFHQHIAYDS